MNGMYKCDFCGYPVDPRGESTAELMTGWVVKGRVAKTVSSTYRYSHKICLEVKPPDTQIGLF